LEVEQNENKSLFFSFFLFFDGGAHSNSHTQNGGESKREKNKEERVIQIYGERKRIEIYGETKRKE